MTMSPEHVDLHQWTDSILIRHVRCVPSRSTSLERSEEIGARSSRIADADR